MDLSPKSVHLSERERQETRNERAKTDYCPIFVILSIDFSGAFTPRRVILDDKLRFITLPPVALTLQAKSVLHRKTFKLLEGHSLKSIHI